MCLAIPAQVIELKPDEMATVEVSGVKKDISLCFVDNIQKGDWIIVHMGYALNRLNEEEAAKTLELFAQMDEIKKRETP